MNRADAVNDPLAMVAPAVADAEAALGDDDNVQRLRQIVMVLTLTSAVFAAAQMALFALVGDRTMALVGLIAVTYATWTQTIAGRLVRACRINAALGAICGGLL